MLQQSLLRKRGFQRENIQLHVNIAFADDFVKAFDLFLDSLLPGDLVVIYYAGHASEMTNKDIVLLKKSVASFTAFTSRAAPLT